MASLAHEIPGQDHFWDLNFHLLGSGMKAKVRAELKMPSSRFFFFKIKIWSMFFLHLLGLISNKSSIDY